ncbi:BRO-N domain-containing protein [Streptomyces physcomitrii]|uniref:Bro-N domain-containing protein n=1 Tax=Streptomyces physcomitrii TaxID=2724184 RepID=A0ABX1GY85_9ACTN|nr:Bro-N domain-containing protein [Streptomyces physcomitrii]NKI41061.1 Bro-N domain-containing protein [Streptomyces physcomitrii]
MYTEYTEESLLDSPAVRATLADRTALLDQVKELPLLPDGTHLTAAMLADYLEVDAVVLRRLVRRRTAELAQHGYRQLQGRELTDFLAANMPERRQGARSLSVFTRRTALVLAMLLRNSAVAAAVRRAVLESVGGSSAAGAPAPALRELAFPPTGQPIRVVVIGRELWFSTADVCRILDRGSPHKAIRIVGPEHTQTIDMRVVTRTQSPGGGMTAGQSGRTRNPHQLNLVSEAGLYLLIMRSDKPAARPFQEWVTAELLPSVRRGDADPGHHRERMARTFTEAVGVQAHVLADIGATLHRDLTVLSDGTVHCPHGEMEIRVPAPGEDSGPPFGPYYRCPAVEAVGIHGSKLLRPCGNVKFVDVVRHVREAGGEPRPRTSAGYDGPEGTTAQQGPEQPPAPDPASGDDEASTTPRCCCAAGAPRAAEAGDPRASEAGEPRSAGAGEPLVLVIGNARLRGGAPGIAAVLRELGVVV